MTDKATKCHIQEQFNHTRIFFKLLFFQTEELQTTPPFFIWNYDYHLYLQNTQKVLIIHTFKKTLFPQKKKKEKYEFWLNAALTYYKKLEPKKGVKM